jgi:ferric-dicitrate binding protein FerR (iron transport regulator)
MNDDPSRSQRRNLGSTLLCLAVALTAGTAMGDSVGGEIAVPAPGSARLTAVSGDTSLGGDPVDRRSDLGDQAAIQTGEDGNAAMLVDEDNLVELCASTKMKLKRHPESGGRIIEVGAGTTRIIVEPGSTDEPLQISTPAAIATILGTVVYVTVDPATGETTIASEDHPVKIESSDPDIKGSTTINGMETLTMRPGEAPGAKPEKLAKSVLENLSGCLKDIHGDALAFDRTYVADKAQERMAAADAEVVDLPLVGLGPPVGPPMEGPGEEGIEDPADVIEPLDIVDLPDEDMFDLPEGCGEIPGDACFPFPQDGEGL